MVTSVTSIAFIATNLLRPSRSHALQAETPLLNINQNFPFFTGQVDSHLLDDNSVSRRQGIKQHQTQRVTVRRQFPLLSPPLVSPLKGLATNTTVRAVALLLVAGAASHAFHLIDLNWRIRWWTRPSRRLLQRRPFWWRRRFAPHTLWHCSVRRTSRRGFSPD